MREEDEGWATPPVEPELQPDEVHVWRASLDRGPDQLGRFWASLSPDERARAARLHFARDRDRWVVARGLLRELLAGYLHAHAEGIVFGYTSYGKPFLDPGTTSSPLRFNVSHSQETALFAFAWERDLGVDVEHVRPEFAEERIAERFFSPREVLVLRSLPAAAQPSAFFRCWTRKEAFIKARGEGLSYPLREFEVTLAPGEPAALVATLRDPGEAGRWSLRDLSPGAGAVGALAVPGHGWRLRMWQWPAEP